MPQLAQIARRLGPLTGMLSFAALIGQPATHAAPADTAGTVVTQPDLKVLQKALAPLANATAIATESELEFSASKAGASFHFREHLKITAKRPGKFTSEVTLLPATGESGPITKYLVTSDGQKVLTYQPGARQYSIVPVSVFNGNNDDMTTLGLYVGPLYLGKESFAQIIASIPKGNTAEVLAQLRKGGMALTSKTQTIEGADYSVFTLNIAKYGAYRFFLDPQGALSRLQVTGIQNGLSINMTETVSSHSTPSAVTPALFQVVPPSTAHKVKYLPVGAF